MTAAVVVCGSFGNPNCYRYLNCPTCGRRRRFLAHYAGLYYGDHLTCLSCGDRWADGELLDRPFAPRWRADSVARAKAQPVVPVAEYVAFVRADLAATFA